MTNKNWRATFLQLCIDHNAAAARYAIAADGRCAELWQDYQEAMR